MISLIAVSPFIAIAAYFAYEFVKDFKNEQGYTKDRILAAGKGSFTIVVARLGVIATGLTQALAGGAGLLGLPEVQTFLQSYFTPQVWLGLLAAYAVVVELARRRSL